MVRKINNRRTAAKKRRHIQDTEHQAQNIELAKSAPHIFLAGPTPPLIDECQLILFIWDSIWFEVDKRKEFGQLFSGNGNEASTCDKTLLDYAYQRKDGVWIVPLGCLKP